MMRHPLTAAPGFENARPLGASQGTTGRRFLLIAAALSIAVHLAAALLIVLMPRGLPREARNQKQGTVELLMVEQKGAKPSPAGQPRKTQPVPPQAAKKAEASRHAVADARTPAAASKPAPTPPVAEKATEPAPAAPVPDPTIKANTRPDAKQAVAQPVRPPSPKAPVFDLAGTESESNAIVLGGQVLPAKPDDQSRNRPPVYPREAAMRGEHGTVVVVIHVSANGEAASVDLVNSSGVAALDRSALDAVRKWHFQPAMQGGRPIPFDLPFRFIFDTH